MASERAERDEGLPAACRDARRILARFGKQSQRTGKRRSVKPRQADPGLGATESCAEWRKPWDVWIVAFRHESRWG